MAAVRSPGRQQMLPSMCCFPDVKPGTHVLSPYAKAGHYLRYYPHAMKRLFSLAIAVFIILPAIASAQDVAITNARVIVGSGQVIESGTIIVKGGKIVSVTAGRRLPRRSRLAKAGRRRVCAPSMRRA